METMQTSYGGGRFILEAKQEERDGVPVGIVAGHLAVWTPDQFPGRHGVPDQFHPGAFTDSIADHRRRNRQIKLRDHHGRTVGGFPLEFVSEDNIGLKVRGEINLDVQQGREAHSMARQGVLLDFSIGFIAIEDKIGPNGRDIFKAEIIEGSIVDDPRNQKANITEVKSNSIGIEQLENLSSREIESFLQSHNFSKKAARFLVGRIRETEEKEEDWSEVFESLKAVRSSLKG